MVRLVTLIVTPLLRCSKVLMAIKSSVPPIPSLSVSDAHALEKIEDKLRSALDNCTDRNHSIRSELKAVTYLRSYAVQIFLLHLAAYSRYTAELKGWIPELKKISVKWVINCLEEYTDASEQDIKKYGTMLLETLDNEMKLNYGKSSNPILASLAETEPESKHGRAYDLSELAMATKSPILVAAAEARRSASGAASAPTPVKSKRRIPRSMHSESAAKKLEDYLNSKCISQTQFAIQINVDQKTLYRFRTTGKVGKPVAQAIAQGMGITLEELISR
jgi:hypothetical protein